MTKFKNQKSDAYREAMAVRRDEAALSKMLVENPVLDPALGAEDVVRFMVAKVDGVALVMERKWGRGTFPQLAGDLMAAKFDSQLAKFDASVQSGMSADVVKHGEAMVRAWGAVESHAMSMGKRPRPVVAFMAALPGGGNLYIVEAQEEVCRITERNAVVMSVAEVAAMLSRDELGRLVIGVKKVFEGVEVQKGPADFDLGDEIPF